MKNVAISQGINYIETRCNLFMILSQRSLLNCYTLRSRMFMLMLLWVPFSFQAIWANKGSCLRLASIYALVSGPSSALARRCNVVDEKVFNGLGDFGLEACGNGSTCGVGTRRHDNIVNINLSRLSKLERA